MTSRERVKMALEHKEPDRVPIQDSPWGATINRWHNEGLPPEISVREYFGFELCSFGADLTPRFPVKTLEKDENFIMLTTPQGGVRRNHRDYSTTPEIIDWPIKTKEDWAKIKERLEPDYTRVDWASGLRNFRRLREEGYFITFNGPIGYDCFQNYVRTEELLVLMITEPDWVREMFQTHARLLIATAEMMIEKGFDFDGAYLFDDMGYRNSSLFSPKTYREVVFETHKMVCDFFHSHDMPIILHSCGCVKGLIPDLIEAGFDCLQPLEVKAGMDLKELKPKYGDQMAFMGGIDVRAMASPDPSLIEEEIRTKFEVAMPGGGYIYHSDHSVPKNVSLQQYKRVMELVKKYGGY